MIVDLVIDVTPDHCDKAYAYMSDFSGYGIVVYSWEKNDSWRIEHNYFYFDPLNGNASEDQVFSSTIPHSRNI